MTERIHTFKPQKKALENSLSEKSPHQTKLNDYETGQNHKEKETKASLL